RYCPCGDPNAISGGHASLPPSLVLSMHIFSCPEQAMGKHANQYVSIGYCIDAALKLILQAFDQIVQKAWGVVGRLPSGGSLRPGPGPSGPKGVWPGEPPLKSWQCSTVLY